MVVCRVDKGPLFFGEDTDFNIDCSCTASLRNFAHNVDYS
jgi:hypothetical protein